MITKHILAALLLSPAAALSSPAAAAQDSEPDTPAYVKVLQRHPKESVTEFEKEHRRLVDSWSETYQLQGVLTDMRNAFGTNRRKKAERMIPRTEAAVDRAYENFLRYYMDARDDYEAERLDLKQEQLKIEHRIDRYQPESTSHLKLRDQIAQLGERIVFYEDRVAILDTLKGALAGTSDSMDTVKHYGINKKTFAKYGRRHPQAVEACHLVKDYHADIAEVRGLIAKEQSDPQLPRILEKLEAGLERAKSDMEEAIADAKAGYERELQRAESDIEKLDARIAAKRERGSGTEREEKARAEMAERVQEIEEIHAFLNQLAAGTEPGSHKKSVRRKETGKKKREKEGQRGGQAVETGADKADSEGGEGNEAGEIEGW